MVLKQFISVNVSSSYGLSALEYFAIILSSSFQATKTTLGFGTGWPSKFGNSLYNQFSTYTRIFAPKINMTFKKSMKSKISMKSKKIRRNP